MDPYLIHVRSVPGKGVVMWKTWGFAAFSSFFAVNPVGVLDGYEEGSLQSVVPPQCYY
jgi:hypothetical protein